MPDGVTFRETKMRTVNTFGNGIGSRLRSNQDRGGGRLGPISSNGGGWKLTAD